MAVYRNQSDGRWLLARETHTLSPVASSPRPMRSPLVGQRTPLRGLQNRDHGKVVAEPGRVDLTRAARSAVPARLWILARLDHVGVDHRGGQFNLDRIARTAREQSLRHQDLVEHAGLILVIVSALELADDRPHQVQERR